MPVRVKQRAMLEDRAENERQWEGLKRSITALLLAWQQPITLVIRDDAKSLRINAHRENDVTNSKVHAQLRPLLSILSQTLYITPDEWSSWVPASAATKSISVKGAISLEPAPSKSVQFISLGIHPIHVEDGHNEFYDEINRLFNHSSFGVNEDEPELGEREKERRLNDKRYKKDGPTRRQLQGGKKGIDRWPMFCLRISLAERTREDVLESEAKLQSILDVLRAMITEWLSAHQFRPTKRKRRTESKPTSASSSTSNSPAPRQGPSVGQNHSEQPQVPPTESSDGKAGADTSHFTGLSKIRSGEPSFYDALWNSEKPAGQNSAPSRENTTFFETELLLPGALGPRSIHTPHGEAEAQDGSKDGTTNWTDPNSKKAFTINSRTGTVIQQSERPNTTNKTPASISTSFRKSLRLDKPSATSDTSKDSWLTTFLSTHSNPVFRPQPSTSESIPRAIFSSPNLSSESANLLHGGLGEHCSHEAIKAAFKEAAVGQNKLSKKALKSARVVSQVDRKFILAIMDGSDTGNPDPTRKPLVVLIDQHAASERVHLESLLTQLCEPESTSPPPLSSPLFFELRHPREASLLEDLAPCFAGWGVAYAVGKGGREGRDVLRVDKLPPGIRERCAERPELLLEVLREEVWRVADGGGRAKGASGNDVEAKQQRTQPQQPDAAVNTPHIPQEEQAHAPPHHTASPLWLMRTSTCPPGILSLLNSRACRSAVMFNDALSRAECEDLVCRLAGCVFPFQCAHGRPSMVPLVELSGGEGVGVGLGLGSAGGEARGGAEAGEGFVHAYRRWRRAAAAQGDDG
ncbi:hypothetical protein BKA80DRAFT_333959 [Phyllosticta citrichinensis]